MRRIGRTLGVALAIAGLVGPAHADVSAADRAAAQGLYDQARDLMQKNDFAKACPMLEESQRLDPGQGTQFNLARCYEGAGRTASAWTLYLDVAEAAKAGGQADREKAARQRAEAIAGRIGRIKIDVADKLGVTEVKRDGQLVGRGQWSAPIPVDPGPHVIVAISPGHRPFEAKIEVKEGQTATVTVTDTPADAAPAVSTGPRPTPTMTDAPPPPPASGGSTQKTIGLVAGGVGVVGVVLGTVFGLSSKSKHDESAGHCVGNTCDSTGVDLRSSAISAGTLSTVFFAVGAVGLGGGATLWLTAPSTQTTGLRVAPSLGARDAGMSVSGRW